MFTVQITQGIQVIRSQLIENPAIVYIPARNYFLLKFRAKKLPV